MAKEVSLTDPCKSLPESQRQVIVLSKYSGFSYFEIATIVGCCQMESSREHIVPSNGCSVPSRSLAL